MTTYTWTGTTSQFWDVGTNWDSGLVPDATIDVLFNTATACNSFGTPDNCLNFTYANATPNVTVNGILNIFGSLTLFAGATFVGTAGNLRMTSTTTGRTITSAGVNLGTGIQFTGVGGGWTLQDVLTTNGGLTFNNGSFSTGNKNVFTTFFSGSNANVRSVSLGFSTISLSSAVIPWDFGNTTNLTFNAGKSTVKLTGSSSSNISFLGGGLTYWNVWNSTTGTGALVFSGNNTFNNFKSNAGRKNTFTATTTTTVASMTMVGTPGNNIVMQSTGAAYNLVSTGADINFYYCTISNCHASGATFTAYNSIDGGGNTGITFAANTNNAWNSNPVANLLTSTDGSININPNGQSIDLTLGASNSIPSFLAYLPSTVNNKTGNGTAYLLGTDTLTTVFDVGSNFSGTTFTAPVTGKFFLKAQAAITNATIANTLTITLSTTARSYQKTISRAAGVSNFYIDISANCDMTAGDIAQVTITAGGEAADTDGILGSATLVTYFCGNQIV